MLEKRNGSTIVNKYLKNYDSFNRKIDREKRTNFNYSTSKNLLIIPNIKFGKVQSKKNTLFYVQKYNSSLNMNLSRNYNNISSLRGNKSSFNNKIMILDSIKNLLKNSKSPIRIENLKKKKILKILEQSRILKKNTINLNNTNISSMKNLDHFPEISILNTKNSVSIKRKEKNSCVNINAFKMQKPKINDCNKKEIHSENNNNNNNFIDDTNNYFCSNVIQVEDTNLDYRKRMIDFNEKLNLQLHRFNNENKTKLNNNNINLPVINFVERKNLTINVEKSPSKNRKENPMNLSLRTKFIDDKEKLNLNKIKPIFKNDFCTTFSTTKQMNNDILTKNIKEIGQKINHFNKLFNKNRINKDLENSKEQYNSNFNDNDNKVADK